MWLSLIWANRSVGWGCDCGCDAHPATLESTSPPATVSATAVPNHAECRRSWRREHAVGILVLGHLVTTTVPCIIGWIEQMYSNVPAFWKVKEYVPPVSIPDEWNVVPSLETTVGALRPCWSR